MKFSLTLVTVAVLATAPAPQHTRPLDPMSVVGAARPLGPEPPATIVTVNEAAPDFSFEAQPRQWVHLHDLLAQGHVMLVFATEDVHLVSLQRERARLLDLGVVPVAVVDRRSGATASTAKRLGLEYPLIADLPRAIASQFNVLDPDTRHTSAAWFVIDKTCRVRALSRNGLPTAGYARIAAGALSIPLPGVPLPVRAR